MPEIFIGKIDCIVSEELKGTNGFGLEPILFLENYQKTLAEIPTELKSEISHRALAMKKLIEYLTNQ
jgi:XTP/dITP diphosphohydrolase